MLGSNEYFSALICEPEDPDPDPPPPPPSDPCGDGGGGTSTSKACDGDGDGGTAPISHRPTPIIVDVDRGGFQLTDLENGVLFDLDADGQLDMVSWTAENSGDAFLVLDRDLNGQIDDGSELFGDNTDQPPSDEPNGYEALAVFDELANGGDEDGLISAADSVFSRLRLWVDSNHDGHSASDELFALDAVDIWALDLRYIRSNRMDRHGNLLRFKSKAWRNGGGPFQTVDVFFLTEVD